MLVIAISAAPVPNVLYIEPDSNTMGTKQC